METADSVKFLKIQLDTPEESAIAAAADVVREGGVIVYPTETVYGIGADARNPVAVRKVLAAKKRKETKPILVLVDSIQMAQTLAAQIPDAAQALMEAFWPGPLTIVFRAMGGIPDEVTQGSGTIGIRLPSNRFCTELVRRCGCPLTSTSANISGEPGHRTIQEIHGALSSGVDLYIDAGVLPETKPSTVVSVVGQTPRIIREGIVSFERLHAVLPQIVR